MLAVVRSYLLCEVSRPNTSGDFIGVISRKKAAHHCQIEIDLIADILARARLGSWFDMSFGKDKKKKFVV